MGLTIDFAHLSEYADFDLDSFTKMLSSDAIESDPYSILNNYTDGRSIYLTKLLTNNILDNSVEKKLYVEKPEQLFISAFENNDKIQLFNPTDSDIELKHYALGIKKETGLENGLIHFTDTMIIKSKGYFTIANKESSSDSICSADMILKSATDSDEWFEFMFDLSVDDTLVLLTSQTHLTNNKEYIDCLLYTSPSPRDRG